MLFLAFSVTAKAEPIVVPDYSVSIYSYAQFDGKRGSDTVIGTSFIPTNRDGEIYGSSFTETFSKSFKTLQLSNNYTFQSKGDPFVYKGQAVTVYVDYVRWSGYAEIATTGPQGNTSNLYIATPQAVAGYFFSPGGHYQYVSGTYEYNDLTKAYDLKFEFTADHAVTYFYFDFVGLCKDFGSTTTADVSFSSMVGEVKDGDYFVTINTTTKAEQNQEEIKDKLDDTNDKLDNVNDKLDGVNNKLESGFASLGEKLSNVFSAITDLPSKIWEFIENGLKSLFIPDEEFMTDYKDRWESSLAEKLGAVWQASNVIFGAWDSVMEADEQDMITMPEVTIPLPSNESFSFGGFDVPIVPDGFDALVMAVKSIVGIGCTLMFINGLRKRYESIMGG